MHDQIVGALGADWKKPVAPGLYDPRMYERVALLRGKIDVVDQYLPDYRAGGAKVLDFSAGSGALLEVLRHYGNEALGADIQYFEFLDSQELPYVRVDGRALPYPFERGSFDLVSCIGSIQTYHLPWRDVITEFCRIARRHVFLIANVGEEYERKKGDIIGWAPAGWRQDLHLRSAFRWVPR